VQQSVASSQCGLGSLYGAPLAMFLFQLLGCHGFRAEQRGLNDHGRHDSETWNKLFDESFCKPAGLVRNTYVARFLFIDDG